MLPVYKAITVENIGIKGGSTKPCLMTVCDDDGNIIGPYVVKVFHQNHVHQTQPTNKEFYCNILAREFELSTPNAAFIKVGQEIIAQLKGSKKFDSVLLLPGVYFGTEYISHVGEYSATVAHQLEQWEMETIFAFDVLVRNIDRRERKPNFFLVEESPCLIDHELCLRIQQSFSDYIDAPFYSIENWNFIYRPDQRHVFFNQLERLHLKEGGLNFETFMYALGNFNPDVLSSIRNQLEQYGNDAIDYFTIKPYLVEVKDNSAQFLNLLRQLLNVNLPEQEEVPF